MRPARSSDLERERSEQLQPADRHQFDLSTWHSHWDPHPVCWLMATLAASPYEYRGLGYRTCPTGGLAITLPDTELLVSVHPTDGHNLTWTIATHHPTDPSHTPITFGSFIWTRLDKAEFNEEASMFQLRDGSMLAVVNRSGIEPETRYRIQSRACPERTVPGSTTWADLPAIEQIASAMYKALLTQQVIC